MKLFRYNEELDGGVLNFHDGFSLVFSNKKTAASPDYSVKAYLISTIVALSAINWI